MAAAPGPEVLPTDVFHNVISPFTCICHLVELTFPETFRAEQRANDVVTEESQIAFQRQSAQAFTQPKVVRHVVRPGLSASEPPKAEKAKLVHLALRPGAPFVTRVNMKRPFRDGEADRVSVPLDQDDVTMSGSSTGSNTYLVLLYPQASHSAPELFKLRQNVSCLRDCTS